MTSGSLRTALACFAVVLMLGACGQYDNDPRSDMTVQQQFDELMRRPTIDKAVARYEEMLKKIRQRLGDELGLAEWYHDASGYRDNGCNDFDKVHGWDAQRQYMDDWIIPRSIPNEKWDRALAIVMDVGGSYGFETTTIAVEKPGYKQVYVNDGWGAQLGLGTGVQSGLSVRTGCHLTTEAHQRGAPRPTPTYG